MQQLKEELEKRIVALEGRVKKLEKPKVAVKSKK